jgi:hypothetical protein
MKGTGVKSGIDGKTALGINSSSLARGIADAFFIVFVIIFFLLFQAVLGGG